MTGPTLPTTLHTGTNNTEASAGGLSAACICRIIKECRKSGVTAFKYNGLEFSFSPSAVATGTLPVVDEVPVSFRDSSVASEVGSDSGGVAAASDLEALEEFQNMQLLIDDPSAHESLMIDRNLHPHREIFDAKTRDIRT